MAEGAGGGTRLMTIGHGTLAEEQLAGLLTSAGVAVLVDVRTYPGSRRNPQFGRDVMASWVPENGVVYRWEPRLGGRRRPTPGSRHTALRHAGFRAYADHMESEEFAGGLSELLSGASDTPTAVMCSESLWWKCHRRLLADAAQLLHGVEVIHLRHDGKGDAHRPTDGVRVDDGALVYDVAGDHPLPGM